MSKKERFASTLSARARAPTVGPGSPGSLSASGASPLAFVESESPLFRARSRLVRTSKNFLLDKLCVGFVRWRMLCRKKEWLFCKIRSSRCKSSLARNSQKQHSVRLHAEKWGVQFWVQPRDWSNTRDLKEFVIDFLIFFKFLENFEDPGKIAENAVCKSFKSWFLARFGRDSRLVKY